MDPDRGRSPTTGVVAGVSGALVYAGFSLERYRHRSSPRRGRGARRALLRLVRAALRTRRVAAAREIVAASTEGGLFLDPGRQHYFADSSLPSYGADAAELPRNGVFDFLRSRST